MLDLVGFFVSYHTLGHVATISMFYGQLSGSEMFLAMLATNVFFLFLVGAFLSFVQYPKKRQDRMIRKFCEVTEAEVENIEHGAEGVIGNFNTYFGHLGYYLAIAVMGFTSLLIGTVIAYTMKVHRRVAWPILLTSSACSFGFWYYSISQSADFIDHNLLTIGTVALTIMFFAYGRVREKKALHKIHKYKKTT